MSICATVGCNLPATHRVTVLDDKQEQWTANVCDSSAEHHRRVRNPPVGATVTNSHPHMRYVEISPLSEGDTT